MNESNDASRVTWLLPVKNGMPYLHDTLASIAAQTYRNFEVLAWDNGSTDGTVEELRKWIPSCLPGRVVSDRPMQLGECRAEMVRQANTELCACIDADDINLPDRLAKQVAFLQAHPEVALVGAQIINMDQNGKTFGEPTTIPLEHDPILYMFLHTNPIAQPVVLFRRSTVLAVGNYQNVGPVNIEDYDLWLRLAVDHQVAYLPDTCLQYRVHEKSTTQLALMQNRLQAAVDRVFCERAPALYGCFPEEARLLRSRAHPHALKVLRRIAQHYARLRNISADQVFRSEDFLYAAQKLIAPTDATSRLTVAAALPRKSALARELKSVTLELLRQTPLRKLHQTLYHALADGQAKQARKRWLRQLSAQGCRIDPTLALIGQAQPFSQIHISPHCILDPDITIWMSQDSGAEARLELKDTAFIGRNTYLGVYQPIVIGANALIGANCYIISANHRYDRRDVPIRDQGFTGAPIVIEDDVWLGTHVVVLPGVTIGKGAIVAAGSIVNKSIPPYEIWGGAPARFIKERPS